MGFLNDDYKIKVGGRKALCTGEFELYKHIYDFVANEIKRGNCAYDLEDLILYEELDDQDDWSDLIDKALSVLVNTSDWKYGVHTENVYAGDNSSGGLIGVQTFPSGFTFVGAMVGGDWEEPVFVMVYWDGKKVRCYIPTYGNAVDVDFGTAFGSQIDYCSKDPSAVLKKLSKKYLQLGLIDDVGDLPFDDISNFPDSGFLTELYFKRYGVEKSDTGYNVNWEAVMKDLQARIVLQK